MEPTSQSEMKYWTSPKHIVVATDLTDAEILLPHAIAQAKVHSAHISIVHALAEVEPIQTVSDAEEASEKRRAMQVLGEMAARLEHEGIRCSISVERGVAETVVQTVINKTDSTRLILGTHHHNNAGPCMIGPVANALLIAATVPVFVVSPHILVTFEHARPRRILHPVSFTGRYSESAAFTLQLAQAYGADLTYTHILDAGLMNCSYVKDLLERANRKLSELVPARSSQNMVHTLVESGYTVPKILKLSESVDWIVMGIEKDFPWWSKRNNAAYLVIAEARCPVLVVHNHLLPKMQAQVYDVLLDSRESDPAIAGF